MAQAPFLPAQALDNLKGFVETVGRAFDAGFYSAQEGILSNTTRSRRKFSKLSFFNINRFSNSHVYGTNL